MWLDDLKENDEVVIHTNTGSSLAKVRRVTKTVILVGEQKFSRKTGRAQGCSGFNLVWLEEVTDKERQRLLGERRARIAQHYLNQVKVTSDNVKDVEELLGKIGTKNGSTFVPNKA